MEFKVAVSSVTSVGGSKVAEGEVSNNSLVGGMLVSVFSIIVEEGSRVLLCC